MLPNMNNKQMQQAMKKIGVKQEEIAATKVIIERADGKIILDNPSVQNVTMMGQESFQISGEYRFEPLDTTPDISEEDIATVVTQTSCTKEQAETAIINHKGDLAEAILELASKE
jgi:nascent polypeptide-associated complex subunit alpha